MKKSILIFSLAILSYSTYAQMGESSFGLQYPILGNPATAGMATETEIFVGYRDHWSGFEGAPSRINAGIQGRLKGQSGVGAILHRRSWGIFDDTGASMYYAHQISLGTEQNLRLGLSTHFLQRSVNDSRLDVDNLEADMLLMNNYSNDMLLQFDFGMLYRWKELTIGLTFPGIYNGTGNNMLANQNLLLMYDFYTSSKDIIFRPSFQFNRNNLLENQQVYSLQVLWKKLIWIQASHNSIAGLMFSAGIQYDKIGFNYGYDLHQGELLGLATGSHEIMMTYRFGKEKAEDGSEKVPF